MENSTAAKDISIMKFISSPDSPMQYLYSDQKKSLQQGPLQDDVQLVCLSRLQSQLEGR